MNLRTLFLRHVGQTSDIPLQIEVDRAEGVYIYGPNGQVYLDMNSGISVSSLGHSHPAVVKAVTDQASKYMHTMVYGEHIQRPQVAYAQALTSLLNTRLNSVYFLNCGTEAVELAMKMSRKITKGSKIVCCTQAYHGSTYGSEALRSDFDFTRNFGPGIPDVHHIPFNDKAALAAIDQHTACMILEPIQAEGGIISPQDDYLAAVRARCSEVGALMVLDEIQTGFGRTGHLFAHHKYNVIPDVLLIAKAMGGGMPIGAVVTDKANFDYLATNPMLGHITTFGGHPVCVAAAIATLEVLTQGELIRSVAHKETLIRSLLVHAAIKEVRSDGLMIAVELRNGAMLPDLISLIIQRGVLVDFFLFNANSFRIAPPLIITDDQIRKGIGIILECLEEVSQKSID